MTGELLYQLSDTAEGAKGRPSPVTSGPCLILSALVSAVGLMAWLRARASNTCPLCGRLVACCRVGTTTWRRLACAPACSVPARMACSACSG